MMPKGTERPLFCWRTASRASRLDAPPCLSRLNGMAGRAVTDSRSGVKADPTIMSTFPGSPALCLPARSRFGEGRGGELHTDPGAIAGGFLKNSVIEKRDRLAKDG